MAPAPRGLRATVTATFALGALLISVALACGTYFTARHLLLEQRERVALRQAFADAASVRDGLLTSGADVSEVLGSIAPPSGTTLLVHRSGGWYSSSLNVSSTDVSSETVDRAAAGKPSFAWTRVNDQPATVVGIPLPAVDAEYYEVATVRELNRTLSTLALALTACAALTTLAGVLVGRAVSRRMLAPLDDVASAATQISSGQLHTRLEPTDDPDLAPLVGAFNDMVDAVNERMQRDARFSADVSHELKSPLTTLVTSVSVLRDDDDLPPRAEQAVGLIGQELARLQQSVEDLLALARLDAGRGESSKTATDLRDLVLHSLAEGHRDPALLVESEPAAVPVLVDRQQLARALRNLFDNADSHGHGLTGVVVRQIGEFAEVDVLDRGPGVAEADREWIFERFARAGSRGSRSGSGLGLSIVRETMREHLGEVSYTPRDDGGGCFTLRLPLQTEDES